MTAPAPVLPTDTGVMGPGTLKIGPTGTEIEVECYVNEAGIGVTADTTEQTTKLCGAVRAGTTTISYTLDLSIDLDLANDSGLFAYTWDNPGEVADFEFVPNTDLGCSFSGQVTTQPLPLDKVAYGADLVAASVSWDIVGQPTRTVTVTP